MIITIVLFIYVIKKIFRNLKLNRGISVFSLSIRKGVFMKNKIKNILKSAMALLIALSIFDMNWTVKAATVHNVTEEIVSGWTNHGTAWGSGAIIRVDGKVSFCLEGFKSAHVGNNEEVNPSEVGLSSHQVNQLALIAWYGYRSQPSTTNYFLTQNLIWKYLGNNTYVTSNEYPTLASQQSWFDSVMNKVNHFHDQPSFHMQSYEINVNDTLSLTDSNGVLNGLSIKSVNGVAISKNGNTLKITPSIDAPDSFTILFNRGLTATQTETNFVVRNKDYDSQSIAPCTSGRDPYNARVSIKVNKFGNLSIAKQDEDGAYVPNTSFKISYASDMSNPLGTYTTGNDGIVLIEQLLPKKVYIQEVSVPAPLILDTTIHSTTIIANDTVEFTATNDFKTGDLEIKKLDVDTKKPITRSNAEFKIYKSDDTFVATVTTNDKGVATLPNVRYGDYYFVETRAPEGYTLNSTPVPFEIRENGVTVKKSLSNKRVVGTINLTKVDKETGNVAQGDATLEGATYELKAKENIKSPVEYPCCGILPE